MRWCCNDIFDLDVVISDIKLFSLSLLLALALEYKDLDGFFFLESLIFIISLVRPR